MRDSSSFWEKTARIGELCWVRHTNKGWVWEIGIVVDIENYSYLSPATYQDWIYHILIGSEIVVRHSYYVEKILWETDNSED